MKNKDDGSLMNQEMLLNTSYECKNNPQFEDDLRNLQNVFSLFTLKYFDMIQGFGLLKKDSTPFSIRFRLDGLKFMEITDDHDKFNAYENEAKQVEYSFNCFASKYQDIIIGFDFCSYNNPSWCIDVGVDS